MLLSALFNMDFKQVSKQPESLSSSQWQGPVPSLLLNRQKSSYTAWETWALFSEVRHKHSILTSRSIWGPSPQPHGALCILLAGHGFCHDSVHLRPHTMLVSKPSSTLRETLLSPLTKFSLEFHLYFKHPHTTEHLFGHFCKHHPSHISRAKLS